MGVRHAQDISTVILFDFVRNNMGAKGFESKYLLVGDQVVALNGELSQTVVQADADSMLRVIGDYDINDI